MSKFNFSFWFENKNVEFSFMGIKVIWSTNPTKVYKNILNTVVQKQQLTINAKKIDLSQIIYIDQLTKTDKLIDLIKKSYIQKIATDLFELKNVINTSLIQEIILEINKLFDCEIIEDAVDLGKIINSLYAFTPSVYLNKAFFLKFLEKDVWSKPMLFIFNEIDWLKLKDVQAYINSHNFLFLTSDLSTNLLHMKELEAVVLDNKNGFTEIDDANRLVAYLEKQLNTELKSDWFNIYLNQENNEFYWKINFFLSQI